jgi:peptidoglycan/LPS O-acetylase OafA/YrhL
VAASTTTIRSPEADAYEPLLRRHMPELDTIRGIAILAVIAYHAFYWSRDLQVFSGWQHQFLVMMSGGQFGVNLFFVLSGFLITGILLDSKESTDYYRRFYFRRALRILPAYYFTIFLLILFGLTSRGFLLMSLIYCSNLCALFGITFMSYAVLWSLSVEEHFYLLWPAAVRKLQTSKLLVLLCVVLIGCPLSRFLYHVHGAHTGHPVMFGYYTWNNADGLALGALVAILMRRPRWGRRETRALAGLFFLVALSLTVAGYPTILTRRTAIGEALQQVPWNLGCAGLLCVFLLIGTSSARRMVRSRFLIFFGRISYGLYLYQVIFLLGYQWAFSRLHLDTWIHPGPWYEIWLQALTAGAAAVVFSYCSRRYLEEPFLRLKDLPIFGERRDAVPALQLPALNPMENPELSKSRSKAAGR